MPTPSYPIADLHCDLLSYLARIPNASWDMEEDIGVALPHLKTGGVKLQVMAIYTATKRGSVDYARIQAEKWKQIKQKEGITPLSSADQFAQILETDSVGILAAIENASGLCEEEEDISLAWDRLDFLEREAGPLLYISFTHHDENRFGGGNYSNNVGLKKDGMALLDRLEGRSIAVDLAHASDQLAEDIFTYTAKQNLKLPIIASHSNFRMVWKHVRNLPDELAHELIMRGGLIGMNFLRAYVDDHTPKTLLQHLAYGWDLGAAEHLAFGADFFYTKDFHDPTRVPLFYPQLNNASVYPKILSKLIEEEVQEERIQKLAWDNVKTFLQKIWSS